MRHIFGRFFTTSVIAPSKPVFGRFVRMISVVAFLAIFVLVVGVAISIGIGAINTHVILLQTRESRSTLDSRSIATTQKTMRFNWDLNAISMRNMLVTCELYVERELRTRAVSCTLCRHNWMFVSSVCVFRSNGQMDVVGAYPIAFWCDHQGLCKRVRAAISRLSIIPQILTRLRQSVVRLTMRTRKKRTTITIADG